MELAARMFSGEVDPEVTSADVYKPAKAAVDAGCDDPMLVYLYRRTSVGPNYPGMPEAIRRTKDAAKGARGQPLSGLPSRDRPSNQRSLRTRRRRPGRRGSEGGRARLRRRPRPPPRERRQRRAQRDSGRTRWFEYLHSLIRGYRALGVAAGRGLRAGRCRAGQGPRAEGPSAPVPRATSGHTYGWEARTQRLRRQGPRRRLRVVREASRRSPRRRSTRPGGSGPTTPGRPITCSTSTRGSAATAPRWSFGSIGP